MRCPLAGCATDQDLPTRPPSYLLSDCVIMEIIETERNYVRDLQQIIDGYLKPLRATALSTTKANTLPAKLNNSNNQNNLSFSSNNAMNANSITMSANNNNNDNHSNRKANKNQIKSNTTDNRIGNNRNNVNNMTHDPNPTLDEIETLFGNIEDVYNFNSSFLSQLEKCGLEAASIAQCFVTHSSGFNVYADYCTNYSR